MPSPSAPPKGGRKRSTPDRRRPAAPPRQVVPWTPMGERRRLATLRRTLEAGLRWAVFERNDEALWAKARVALTDLLRQEWQRGALVGSSEEQAFFVRCDQTTMTTFDVERGQLIVLVGLAFRKPAEFSVLRIEQSTAN